MKYVLMLLVIVVELYGVEGTVMIEVSYEENQYKIERAWKIDDTFPSTLETVSISDNDIVIKIKDENSTVVGELRLSNPKIIRGVFAEYSELGGHVDTLKKKGSFILRYPYKKGLKYLKIINARSRDKTSSSFEKKVKTDMEFGSLLFPFVSNIVE